MQSGLEAQLSFMPELTRKSYDSVRQLSALNMHFMQQFMHDWAETSRQLASCRDPLQLAATAARAAQPVFLHLHSYQQQLVGVLTGTRVELTRSADASIPEAVGYASAIGYTLAHESAPSGSAGAARPEYAGDSAAGSAPHSLH